MSGRAVGSCRRQTSLPIELRIDTGVRYAGVISQRHGIAAIEREAPWATLPHQARVSVGCRAVRVDEIPIRVERLSADAPGWHVGRRIEPVELDAAIVAINAERVRNIRLEKLIVFSSTFSSKDILD